MSAITLRLPDSLYEAIKQSAEKEGISINQFLASAAAEKLAAWATEEYLETRAKRASVKKFRAAIGQIRDIEPEEEDKL